MPLLPTVGRKALRMRMLILSIYGVLALGGVTMVIPFLITLTCSVSNRYDLEKYNPIPTYFWNDDELYCKYLFEKYDFNTLRRLHALVHLTTEREMRMARNVVDDFFPAVKHFHSGVGVPNIDRIRSDYESFLKDYPPERLGGQFPHVLEEKYRQWLKRRYILRLSERTDQEGSERIEEAALRLFNQMNGEVVATEFALVEFGLDIGFSPKAFEEDQLRFHEQRAFLAEIEPKWKKPEMLDDFFERYAKRKYTTLSNLNAAWDTSFEDFIQVRFPVADIKGSTLADDKIEFLSKDFPLRWVTVSEEYASSFREYLREKFETLKIVNLELLSDYASWNDIPFTNQYSGTRPYRKYWSQFVVERVPVQDREYSGFEIDYARYLRDRYGDSESLSRAYGMSIASIEDFRIPFDYLDYQEFHVERSAWRRFFIGYNYAVVLRFLSTRGRAVWNTFVLVGLTVLAGLFVNPITAYALSRFNLRNTQRILVFLLIPMSFPPEVSMIPSFLLLRSFPLGLLIMGGGTGAIAFLALRRFYPAWSTGYKGFLQIAGAFVLGRLLALPLCRLLNVPPSVTLLNTYSALVLPGMASGFSIFLLKGFFDGLPRELYEAASIDGASELQMFRVITYPLCKPIIVVTLMSQVLAAYGGFMWAFVVCQDKRMWTLMVWLYAFQSEYAVGQLNLIMAALTLASIPTFLFFIFCQRVIMRGIILPSMK